MEALRRSLLGGGGDGPGDGKNVGRAKRADASDIQSRLDARVSSRGKNESSIDALRSRGRISGNAVPGPEGDDVVIGPPGS